MRASLRCSPPVIILALVVCTTACTTWRTQWVSPSMVIEGEQPSKVRVVRTDSTRIVVEGPHVAADSLTGRARNARVAVPLSEVAYLQVRRSQPMPAVALIAVVVEAGMWVLLAATWD